MKNNILEAIAKTSVFGTDEVHRVYEIFKSYDLIVLGCDYAIKNGYSNLETACILVKSAQQSMQADFACTCAENDLVDLVMFCSNCGGKVPQSR